MVTKTCFQFTLLGNTTMLPKWHYIQYIILCYLISFNHMTFARLPANGTTFEEMGIGYPVLNGDSNDSISVNDRHSPRNDIAPDSYTGTGDVFTLHYQHVHCLIQELLHPNRYNPHIRPVNNQSQKLWVSARLSLLELVSLDNVQQKMVTDVYLLFVWNDELLVWDKDSTGNFPPVVTPSIDTIWKPDITLYNALERRDVLGVKSRILPKVSSNGQIIWGFNDILTTSCNLDMDKYPFDVQTCYIEFASTTYRSEIMDFRLLDNPLVTNLMSKNYGWDVVETKAEVSFLVYMPEVLLPVLKFTLKMKRKSTFILMNDIFPSVTLSFLNCFVFLVPIDSGEKISFGISVLLALAMFIGTVSTRLPAAAAGMSALTKYLGFLFLNSVVSVILTLAHVRLHQRAVMAKENEIKRSMEYENPPTRLSPGDKSSVQRSAADSGEQDNGVDRAKEPGCNNRNVPYNVRKNQSGTVLEAILKYADLLSFLFTMGIWCSITIWYFRYVQS